MKIIAGLLGWREISVLELKPNVDFKRRALEAATYKLLEQLRPFRTYDGTSTLTADCEFWTKSEPPKRVTGGEYGLHFPDDSTVWVRR